jgi:hypothetical protein
VNRLDKDQTKDFIEGRAAHQYHEALSLADNKTVAMLFKGYKSFWALSRLPF